MNIGVTDQGGKRREYKVKPLDDITVRDYIAIASPPLDETLTEDYDRLIELMVRHTSIPRRALNKMPAIEVRRLMDAMAVLMDDVSKALEKADRTDPPKSFEFKGVKYTVPQNIESDLTFGQAESLNKSLLPKCDTDAEGYTAILAVCCQPEGEEFDGAKMSERLALFLDIPVRVAFGVCAFFFDSSEQLRQSMQQHSTWTLTSLTHKVEQALTSMSNVTGG